MESTRFAQTAEPRLTPETAPKLSYKEYRNPGGDLIPLHYCTSLEAAEYSGQQLLEALEHSERQVVGVDCITLVDDATKSGAGISSIHFAVLGSKGCIVIVHSSLFSVKDNKTARLPRSIIAILSSSDILKVGHGAVETGDFLHKFFGIGGQAFLELGHIHSRIQEKTLLAHKHDDPDAQAQYGAWGGLHELVFSYLDKRLDRVWHKATPMTEETKEYVAGRALCAVLIFEAMDALDELPPPGESVSTDHSRLPIAVLPVHSENVHVSSAEEIAKQIRRKQDQSKRVRDRKNRRNQAEYDELNPDSQDLYKDLLALRYGIHKSTGMPLYKILNTKNIYLLAWKKPTTIADIKEIKFKAKATQEQFAYDFVNAARLHLGLETLVEPSVYQQEPVSQAQVVNEVTAVGFWTPSLLFLFDSLHSQRDSRFLRDRVYTRHESEIPQIDYSPVSRKEFKN